MGQRQTPMPGHGRAALSRAVDRELLLMDIQGTIPSGTAYVGRQHCCNLYCHRFFAKNAQIVLRSYTVPALHRLGKEAVALRKRLVHHRPDICRCCCARKDPFHKQLAIALQTVINIQGSARVEDCPGEQIKLLGDIHRKASNASEVMYLGPLSTSACGFLLSACYPAGFQSVI